jgi:hypothetical protein
VQTGLGRFAECVLTLSLAAGLVSCGGPRSQPSISISPVASSPAPSKTASPTSSADQLKLREAEGTVSRFWSVIDRLSVDPDSDLTELTTVSRGSVAAQWAKNINQDRYDRVRSSGNVVVRDAMAIMPHSEGKRGLSLWLNQLQILAHSKAGGGVHRCRRTPPPDPELLPLLRPSH